MSARRIPTFDECTFGTRSIEDGRWVGFCDQFSDIRSRPHNRRLDALDDVMTRTAAKIAQLDDAADRNAGRKAAPRS